MGFGATSTLCLILIATQFFRIFYAILYRLFFSPLAKVPGPKLAALTSWYECYYDVFLPGKYVFKIKDLHAQYGPVVRITPREVSISDLEFLDTIYAPGPHFKRNKDIEKVKALGINASIGGAVEHDLHRKRRESLNPYFSKKSVTRIVPQIEAKITQLNQTFTTSAYRKDVVNLSDLYFAFSSEQVARPFLTNLLANPAIASTRRKNVAAVLREVKFNLHFSWVRSMTRMLPQSFGLRFIPQGIKDMIAFRMKIRQEIQGIILTKEQSGGGKQHSIFHELLDSPTLPPSEKTVQRLEDEATLLVIAGTESTAKSICIAHYHLLANKEVMDKLRSELSANPSTTFSELDRLPYLHSIALEANRLSFGLTGRNPRVSPDQVIQYTNPSSRTTCNLPLGTPISTSTLLAHTNEAIFPDPWTFEPDRWLGDEGQQRKKYMLAFSKGPRQCIGMHLAEAELLLTIAEMAKWDMDLFETDEDDVKFLHDYHVATPRLNSSGVRGRINRRYLD